MVDESEFRAYPYIVQVLKDLQWDIRNPRRGGEVYTQGEFRQHDDILTEALGRKTPENIILIPGDGGHKYWIIEAKAKHKDIGIALAEAKKYADAVNKVTSSHEHLARFITGIAGTPDQSFYVKTQYWNGDEWHDVAINDYETTGFLSREQCRDILDANSHRLALFDDNPKHFLKKANAINKTLHENEIPVGDRAKIMAALLLALAQDGNLRIHANPKPLMREINGLIEDLLRHHGKEDFANVIKLTLPATEKNHKKYRKAIIETLQHLREMNIRSAINSGDDALGKFYETFLKYANGAKEMGIVLTPRHITKFAIDVVGVGRRDRVFDPACGTGGFLIAAMESMRSSNPKDYEKLKNDGLFGVEQRDDIYGLAIVNMIFRGDGKSRVYDGNCFDHEFWLRDGNVFYTLSGDHEPEGATKPFSRVLMNPPFKLKSNDETQFVDYALRQMRKGGLLFAVVPAVVVSGSRHQLWRQETLNRHTFLACVKFDKNLFYPIAEATYGLILCAHEPHKNSKYVFMGCLFDDDHRPRKSKMLSRYETVDNVERMTVALRRFLLDQPVEDSLSEEQCTTTLNLDLLCDFSPEAYLTSAPKKIHTAFRAIGTQAAEQRASLTHAPVTQVREMSMFPIHYFIDREERARVATLKEYPKGNIPVVASTYLDNGVADWLSVPDELCLENCITISTLHNTRPCEAFWHAYRFAAVSGKVLVIRPILELIERPLAILYLCESITMHNAWRYHYARSPKLHELEVGVPIQDGGQPDFDAMSKIVEEQLAKD